VKPEREDLHRLSSEKKRALLASLLQDRAQRTKTVHPLSANQKALWLLQQRSPGGAAYNTAFAVRVRSQVDPGAFRAALQTVVDRHACLRTTFSAENGKPVAVVHAHHDTCLAEIDLRGRPLEDVRQRASQDYRQPFDLQRGPLLRASLYSMGERDHILLLTFHHIICDAWSIWLIMHELGVSYAASIAGRPAELPPVQAQYADFVRWQSRSLAGPEGERLWRYWREKLSGELPVLELSATRPAVQTFRGASHFFRLDKALAQGLLQVGKAQGATLFVCLLAIFQTLLYRYSGHDDIIVGSPVAGRTNPDMASTVGYFANVLPLRVDLSAEPTFRELISQVREAVLGALANQDFPFPLLVEKLMPRRDASHSPIVEAMFVLQSPPKSAEYLALLGDASAGLARWAGLDIEPFGLAQMEGQFDLTWEVFDGQQALPCVLKYNPDLFDAGSIARMEGHLKTLIKACIDNPEQRIGRASMMTAAEAECLLARWQGVEKSYPLHRTLHPWIEDQVERSPDRIAVEMADAAGGQLSYRELNERANRLARHLGSLQLGHDAVVGVLAERSPELVVALLAVLKAGAAYLPLDPEYPPQRLAFMIAEAGIGALVTHRDLSNRLPAVRAPIVRLDDDWPTIAQQAPSNPTVAASADDLAYVIYTSGSTGQPKGSENTHRGICNRLLWMQDEYRLDDSDRVLQKTPFSFDVSVWEFFWPLMTGATLVVARPGGHRDRDYLVETIIGRRITTLHFVPSMLEVFLGATGVARCQPALRRVFCSGEALSSALQQRFFARLSVELHNLYGPTEAAVDVIYWRCLRDTSHLTVPIGKPIANTRIYLLDRNRQPVPVGVPGELYIGGPALARGYRNRPELTAERFVEVAVGGRAVERLYRSGDLCRWRPDGTIEYLRRTDFQVKLRGFRIELGEIESALCAHPQIREAIVQLKQRDGDARLYAWIVQEAGAALSDDELRRFLKARLPDYMVPAGFVTLASLPLNANGKADRAALRLPGTASLSEQDPRPRTETERRIADIWRIVLRHDRAGLHDNFFGLGGHSLLLAEVQARLSEAFGKSPSTVEMFEFTTIHALAGFYAEAKQPQARAPTASARATARSSMRDIAIIGMAGRFPGAADVGALWQNLAAGIESITTFTDAQLAAAGVSTDRSRDANYVRAFGALAGIEEFDAEFFGHTPREAELMDVQHRLLLECAWAALENAAHDPQREDRRYGMFAGVGLNRYLLNNLMPHRALIESIDPYQLALANDKDFAPTRVSYKLNLRGPSVSVQTACSTSLVAVHLACQSLLADECDTALAGGCSVTLPQDQGYLYQDGMILSPDGHCRTFDARARGTVGGSGVGLVVLKRLDAAIADGDNIHAVIKGSAINNDGSGKAGFTAPGIAGQAAVISSALASAGIGPDTIGYIEAHGTGTPLGDPIEIAALGQVFRGSETGRVAIGSVKTNLGHLDTAAGVTGLIKAALAVKYGLVPPSLHFEQANPELKLEASPFFVPTALRAWTTGTGLRRAGVSSFGIGGTNAHVVIEQPPEAPAGGPGRPYQLLVISARQPTALDALTESLARHLRDNPGLDLANVAFTLAAGRRPFGWRRFVVCRTTDQAAAALEASAAQGPAQPGKRLVDTSAQQAAGCGVAFMFSGQGAQHVNMAAEIYRSEPVFRAQVDRCAALLARHLGFDLRDIIYPRAGELQSAAETLKQTAIAQPALFVVEYALAQLWMSWGVRPEAMIGHSLGEYVGACLAGVWTLEAALELVALRAKLMQQQSPGAMLALSLSEEDACKLLHDDLSLAAINGPNACVLSGPEKAIDSLAQELSRRDIAFRRLETSHAFHSAMMEPARELFLAQLEKVEFRSPAIPFVSNVTGTWTKPDEATGPEYWARHLRQTVRFSEGLATLLSQAGRCLIEVGPGNTLAALALRHPHRSTGHTVVSSLPHPQEQGSDLQHLLESAGKTWLAGADIDWTAFYAEQQLRRLPLPTYPFQRRRYWIDPPRVEAPAGEAIAPSPPRRGSIDDWFYVPAWQRTPPPAGKPEPGSKWLLLMDEHGVGDALAARLAEQHTGTIRVRAGPGFGRRPSGEFVVDPGSRRYHELLFAELRGSGDLPDVVVHLWNVTMADSGDVGEVRDRSFHNLVTLAQGLGEEVNPRACHIAVVSTKLHDVIGTESLDPMKALLLGPVAVIPQEYAHLSCSSIDLDAARGHCDEQITWLLADAAAHSTASAIAYRGAHRWQRIFEPVLLPAKAPMLRPGGSYLITGGTGGVGLALAERLAELAPGARLALLSRSASAKPLGRLNQLGAQVLALQADVSDRVQMQRALEAIRQRFGIINGVIHAAGIAGGGTIAVMTRDQAELEFAAKVDGTLVLEATLAQAPLDFFMLCSSLTAVTGGLGQAAYSAANAFVDAFAQMHAPHRSQRHVVSINWDRWQGTGMAGRPDARPREPAEAEADRGMERPDAIGIFDRIAASAIRPRIVVSTHELAPLIERSRAPQLERIEKQANGLAHHPRPPMTTDFVAPAGEVECQIAEIWQEELGIEPLGSEDDFFALGGDSLIAIKLMSRLRQSLQISLNVRSLYEAPTIRALADQVASIRWALAPGAAADAAAEGESGVL
jgi:amino acid adenylation domain-containing protein